MQDSFVRFVRKLISRPPVLEQPRKQPVPDVTDKDVKRVVDREFPYETVIVMSILEEHQSARCGPRVQLAALKLAKGNIEKLRQHIQYAFTRDYRDVLVAAEYPEYHRIGWDRIQALADEERSRIIDQDWKQYEDWLSK